MKIGFTGTQTGMTEMQQKVFYQVMLDFGGTKTQKEFHHGDCIGADAQAHRLACCSLGWKPIIHPPRNPSKRAWCATTWPCPEFQVLPTKEYLERNHDIVDTSFALIATPAQDEEQLRSGTWATIRYAKKKNIHLAIIYPLGNIWYSE